MKKLVLVTIHLPEKIVEDIDELVRNKSYPTRSEAIRSALKDLLEEEDWMKTGLHYKEPN